MDATSVLLIVLLVVASVACGFVMWAVTELVATVRSMRKLADDLDASLMPLLEKTDVTVDSINIELLRIDEIVTRVEEVTDRVSSTSRAVQEVANAPAEIVNEIAGRVRNAFKARKHAPRHASPNSDTADSDETAITASTTETVEPEPAESGSEPESTYTTA